MYGGGSAPPPRPQNDTTKSARRPQRLRRGKVKNATGKSGCRGERRPCTCGRAPTALLPAPRGRDGGHAPHTPIRVRCDPTDNGGMKCQGTPSASAERLALDT